MGCGLNKLEKHEDKRPGNIYSTLKRPQVETKIDVSYEYRFLEFTTLGTTELPRSSAVRLASLRDLPAQLLELYHQGFSLVALHPFVQPTHEREKSPLEHIFRAILIKKTDRSQKTDLHNEGYILELDCCSSLAHLTDQKIIPEFIKKVQEAASQGLKFVGVIPQYQEPRNPAGSSLPADTRGARLEPGECADPEAPGTPVGTDGSPEPGQGPGAEAPATQQPSWPSGEAAGTGSSPHGVGRPLDGPDSTMARVRTQQLSGSKCVSQGHSPHLQGASQEAHDTLGKRNGVEHKDSRPSDRAGASERLPSRLTDRLLSCDFQGGHSHTKLACSCSKLSRLK